MTRILSPLLALACAVLLLAVAGTARAQEETEPAADSTLTGVKLPTGAIRVLERSMPADVTKTLASLVKVAGPEVRQGRTEVLAWTGGGYKKERAPRLIEQVGGTLQGSGWSYEVGEQNKEFTIFSLTRAVPTRRACVGFWVPSDDALVLAWTELLLAAASTPAAGPVAGKISDTNEPPRPTAPPASATIIEVDESTRDRNVMGRLMPKMPTFPTLAPKPDTVRGYVYDTHGKPLQGARIGVRSTAAGGFYSGAASKTDANGYYEIAPPRGAAHFYCAGYAIDYGDGRAALGLHPADGELDSFATPQGHVENFVLLPYGIADRDGVQENSRYANNYYGGSIVISYSVADDRSPGSSDLPAGSQIEITLVPESPLIDGSRGQPFVIRKRVGSFFGQLYVNNIPVAAYRISAKLVSGGPLRMKETGPNGGAAFGIGPKQATGTATLLLRPAGAKAEMAIAAHGNWDQVSITLERP